MHDATDLVTEPAENARPARLASLDVFRGLTIAGMILVNNGTGPGTYAPLRHASWDGWTPTDLVFPFFLLIVGVAIPFSLGKRRDDGAGVFGLLWRIIRRAFLIFGIGLILNGFPDYLLAKIRIPGVLQRIALCYLFASLIDLMAGVRLKMTAVVILLIGYYLAMTFIAAPGHDAGDLSREGNLAASVDRAVLAGHLYKADYDPEGLLSTIPALATTLIGVLAGHWLRSGRMGYEKNAGLFVAGWFGIILGWIWSATFPINKALWTSSFVLLTAGLGLQLLAVCYWLVDLKAIQTWSKPFAVFGRNAIAAYVLAAIVSRLFHWPLGKDGKITISEWFVNHGLKPWLSPGNVSLAYASTFVMICFGIVYLMHRKNLYLKV